MKNAFFLLLIASIATLSVATSTNKAEASIEQLRASAVQILSEQIQIIRRQVNLLEEDNDLSVSDILVPEGGKVAESVADCIDEYEDEVTEEEIRDQFILNLSQQIDIVRQSIDMVSGNASLSAISAPPPSQFMKSLQIFMSECIGRD